MQRSRLVAWLAPLLAALSLSACAPGPQETARGRLAHVCTPISGDATMGGRSLARRQALVALYHNVDAARTFMARGGLRHIRIGPRRFDCRPYQLFDGLTRCEVVADVCGRPF
jgi:hypothetical protein